MSHAGRIRSIVFISKGKSILKKEQKLRLTILEKQPSTYADLSKVTSVTINLKASYSFEVDVT